MKMPRDQVFNIRLDSEDRDILDAIAEAEKLPRSDVLRRGLRHYGKLLGVKVPKRRAKK